MLLEFVQLLAGVGFLCLLLSWWTGRDEIAMIVGIAGSFAWGLATYGALNVEVLSGGASFQKEYPAIALFCLGMAFLTFLPALVNPFELIGGARDAENPAERI